MPPEVLVRSGTSREAVPFVAEITLLTAAAQLDLWELWDRTARDAPPFWAYPWAGGQALARYILDNPGTVAGRRVLDVASGSGLVAIAAAKAGAASVVAGDIDPNAVAAIGINAQANDVPVAARAFDFAADAADAAFGAFGAFGADGAFGASGADGADGARGAQVVFAGDVFYQRELAALALRWLRGAAAAGADVLVADPGRAFLPTPSLTPLISYQVPVLSILEDASVKEVAVYRLT